MIGKGIVSFATTIYGHPRRMLIDYLITPLSRFRHTCGKNVGSDEIITGEKEIVTLPGGLCQSPVQSTVVFMMMKERLSGPSSLSGSLLAAPSGAEGQFTPQASSGNTCLASFLPQDLLQAN